jgi:hypothetical protein
MRKKFFISLILSVALALAFASCKKMEKPFIITSKDVHASGSDKGYATYSYRDKSGWLGVFQDKEDKYDVGDVIE